MRLARNAGGVATRLAMVGAAWLAACSPPRSTHDLLSASREAAPRASASATAPVAPLAPARAPVATTAPVLAPPCPAPTPGTAAGPLEEDRVQEARSHLTHEERQALAGVLGVDCAPEAVGFDDALVQAVARFQRRYGRFEDEVTGRVDARTRRQLEMLFPALRGPKHPCSGVEPAAVGVLSHLPACLLRWSGASDEELSFMRLVYQEAQKRAALRRPFVMAADEVDVIERGPCPGKPSELEPGCRRTHLAERSAALSARRLLEAARATFDADRKQHGQRNLLVFTGYRSAPFQLEVWEYHFPARYRATAAARKRAVGGPHGLEAARLLAGYYAVRTAPPGHSLHGRGLAIDFGCVTPEGDWIGSNGSFVKAWKSSYCFRWLTQNAGRFGFQLNKDIDEPWHWEYVGGPLPP